LNTAVHVAALSVTTKKKSFNKIITWNMASPDCTGGDGSGVGITLEPAIDAGLKDITCDAS
jgi:hypothetical protein